MAILAMEKVRWVVAKDSVTPVLRAVQKLGVVEFRDVTSEYVTASEKQTFEFDYVSSRLDFAVDFLQKYEAPKGKLRQMVEGARVPTTEAALEELANTYYFNDIIEKAQNLETDLNDAENHLKQLAEEKAQLSAWRDLDATLANDLATHATQTLLYTGKPQAVEAYLNQVAEENMRYAVPFSDEAHVAITVLKEDMDPIASMAHQAGLESVTLPRRRGTPAEELERIARAEEKAQQKKAETEAEIAQLTSELPKLKALADYFYWKKVKHDYIATAAQTQDTFVFEGWAMKKYLGTLEHTISQQTPYYAFETIPPAEGEEPPVEIENNALIKPFESITRLYGLPGAKDLDPTLFLSGFFFLFFGLSLTDVGYGLILAGFMGALLFFFNVPREAKPLYTLLMFGGISSFIAGLFFGGYLGIDMSAMPAWLQAIQTFDPIANPLPIFYLSLALGVVQILFGLFLGIYREAKHGSILDGILDNGPWIATFVALGLFGANMLGYLSGSQTLFLGILGAAVLSIVLTQGRKENSLVKKFFKGLAGLYDSVGYLSDILSYSRLLALGLATTALAFAINLIAELVGDMVPYVGPVVMAVILIIGHLFTLAVNALGAFIHSARLQFVEFFGKFISGNGRAFMPFERKERHTILKG